MKKFLFTILILFLGGAYISRLYAEFPQIIPLQIINEDGVNEGNTKNPPLTVFQNYNVLTLSATQSDYTLQLRDVNDTVVYSCFVPVGSTQIILPTSISGSFEMEALPTSGGIDLTLSIKCENSDMLQQRTLATQNWDVKIYNAVSGEIVYSSHLNCQKHFVNTTGWSRGTYLVKAIIDEQETSCKILVK